MTTTEVQSRSPLRVMVAQMGARHNYAYPIVLEKHDLLSALLTDFCLPARSARPSLVTRILPQQAARRTVDLPVEKIKSSPVVNLIGTALRFAPTEYLYSVEDDVLGLCGLRLLRDIDVLVNTFGNGGGILERSCDRGIKIVTDMVIAADHLRIIMREQELWPDWEPSTVSKWQISFMERKVERLLGLSDRLICPSLRVVESIEKYSTFAGDKVEVLHYPTPVWAKAKKYAVHPVAGRVLFAGTACLRKGIHVFARAANIIRSRGHSIDFIVAGGDRYGVASRAECAALQFVGHLDNDRLSEQLAIADVFCLPTLCEGSPSAILEALAVGLPVITTKSAGALVSDGLEGLIVPERDPEALADAIIKICGDRELRNFMAGRALALSDRFSTEAWEEKFIELIHNVGALQ